MGTHHNYIITVVPTPFLLSSYMHGHTFVNGIIYFWYSKIGDTKLMTRYISNHELCITDLIMCHNLHFHGKTCSLQHSLFVTSMFYSYFISEGFLKSVWYLFYLSLWILWIHVRQHFRARLSSVDFYAWQLHTEAERLSSELHLFLS